MPNVGDTVICTETGKQFVVASNGCSFNYATDREGRIFSDEGVDIRERRGLLDRSKPFYCYLSSDGKRVTGWKGNMLGTVTSESKVKMFMGVLVHVRVTDVHGGHWYGKGSGHGMSIRLRPNKEKVHA